MRESLKQAFMNPTYKQREAYGRFFHTISAAALVGGMSVMYTETSATTRVVEKLCGLFLSAVVCFAIGGILSKGE